MTGSQSLITAKLLKKENSVKKKKIKKIVFPLKNEVLPPKFWI